MKLSPRNLLITLGLLPMSVAHAHDFWLEPSAYRASQGAVVEIRLREGVGFRGNTLPYLTDWFEDFSTVTVDGREDVISLQGDDPAARFEMPGGAVLLGYQSRPSLTSIKAPKFNDYLAEEGLEFVRELRKARGEDQSIAHEFFVRCAKSLLQHGPDSGDLYAMQLGYVLELTPEANPYDLAPGDELTFTLLWNDEPAEGLLLQAFARSDPERIQQVRIDADGRATVQLHSAGEWLVKAVSIERLDDSPQADWISHWASFTFSLPGG